MNPSSRGPRYKQARLIWSFAKNLAKGWVWHMSVVKANPASIPLFNNAIAEFDLPIRERPELRDENFNRRVNMRIAAKAIDGCLIESGGIFSLQSVIGEATTKKGYRSGPVVVGGKLSTGPGGGLCQIATVLFNAALQANMEILEKHNHSADVWGKKRLIALGRDAVYAYAIKDFKFRNILSSPILLRIVVNDTPASVTVRILSDSPLPSEILVQTVVSDGFISGDASGGKTPVYCAETRRYLLTAGGRILNYFKKEYYLRHKVVSKGDQ